MDESVTGKLTGKILFVDDEANILRSLRREFIDTDYEVYLAQSAGEGLRILEKEDIDIVVSEYKMAGEDGLKFLKAVMKQFPATYRVLLSGFVEEYAVLKALSSGLVSAFIPKPWETDVLRKKLSHLLLTKHALKSTDILRIVNSVEDLPTLPSVYNEFAQAVENERPYNELTSIITKDIGATTRLIRIASSAYYHLDKGISIERALSYIGINAIRQILLFTSLADGAQWDTRRRKHLFDISIHSVLVNYGVCELYRIEHEAPIPEHYTSVGITHDIGKVIMLGYLPERFDRVITCMKDHPGLDFYQGELSLGFGGTTHAEIGAFFLDLWGLPGPSIEAGLYHHDPKNGPEGGDNGESILELCRTADLLSNYIVLRPDAAHEELPGFLERYTKKNEIHDLIVALEEKYEHFQ